MENSRIEVERYARKFDSVVSAFFHYPLMKEQKFLRLARALYADVSFFERGVVERGSYVPYALSTLRFKEDVSFDGVPYHCSVTVYFALSDGLNLVNNRPNGKFLRSVVFVPQCIIVTHDTLFEVTPLQRFYCVYYGKLDGEFLYSSVCSEEYSQVIEYLNSNGFEEYMNGK